MSLNPQSEPPPPGCATAPGDEGQQPARLERPRPAAQATGGRQRPWKAAVLWLGGCSALFMVAYGGCNWVTSLRPDVGTWYYEWELHIPFVPAMIIPYWSIDLFFVASFFLCGNRRELDTLGRRLVLAILVAAACFLLLPLRIGFPRPEVHGVLGAMFNGLRAFDHPYNLVPSLHIAFRTILADLYARHTRGTLRLAVHAWFSLIGLSTVLTYQHQVVDVLGGFLLATLCFYAFRESSPRLPTTSEPRVGRYYAAGSVAAMALALVAWPLGSALLWPALALGLVAAGYFGLGPSIFRKEHGRLPLSTRVVLGPFLLGQEASRLHYKRGCRPWDAVVPGVLIGRKLSDREACAAVRGGVSAVLDLTADFSEAVAFLGVAYLNLPTLDLTAPTTEQLNEAAAFISDHAARGTIYVHCKIGYSRSAAAVGAYLLSSRRAATAEEAIAIMRKARPSLVVRPEVLSVLRAFRKTASSDAVQTPSSRG